MTEQQAEPHEPDAIAPRKRNPGERPAGMTPPPHLSPNIPVPAPQAVEPPPPNGTGERREPTRYGDWEYKGIAIDF